MTAEHRTAETVQRRVAGTFKRPRAAACGRSSAIMILAVALALMAGLAACGKKGPPVPPGPQNQVTYPRTYPTH